MGSGIADYSYELVPLVAEKAEVHVVCPQAGRFRRVRVPTGAEHVSTDRFQELAASYDAVFYHLGNNPWHEFVYDLALKIPGVAVFHDFVLHHLLAHLLVEAHHQPERYVALMRQEYGAAGQQLALLRLQRVATDFEKFLFPLNGHLARRSLAIVVHSEDSRERMREIAPGVPVVVIPHHAGNPPESVRDVDREEARSRLGLPGDAFIVGHFGFITRPKQPGAVVGGFAKLAAEHSNALLVMTGADNTGGGLDRLIRRHRLSERVRSTGFVDLTKFYLYLKAVDAVINLRYPSAGESSGTFARALAEGRAVIVNDLGSFGEVPSDVALKVEIDGDQVEAVGAHLLRLAGDPGFRSLIERRAHEYAATVLDPVRCRDLYLTVAHLEELKRKPHLAPDGHA
jgi:glycosyltransferase involved in cell wall biosynthesis